MRILPRGTLEVSVALCLTLPGAIARESRAEAPQNKDEEGVTALMRAARDGERKSAIALLEQALDVNARDTHGWSALTYSAAKGDAEIIKALLAKGAEINSTDQDGYSPLLAAVTYHNTSAVKLLIEKGADVNQPDKNGATPLSAALEANQSGIAGLLKKAGAKETGVHHNIVANAPKDPGDTRPVILNNPEPSYTTKAQRDALEGAVRARVLVGGDGTVKKVWIITGLPDGLSYQAMEAAYRMIFNPARKGGQPVAYWMPVVIEFRLRR